MLPMPFAIDVPPELVAQQPLAQRSASRLLHVLEDGGCADLQIEDLPQLLRAGDLLVLNDTRVLPARLHGRKASGGAVELLLERILAPCEARMQLRASRAPRSGTRIIIDERAEAMVSGRDGPFFLLRFSEPVQQVLERCGHVPLPPYIRRDDQPADRERYQTVFSRQQGSVAAPTAGLHFDSALLAAIAAAGVETAFLTLHVGAGTFRPVQPEQLESRRLHAEQLCVPAELCAAVARTRAAGGRVIAVGTTVVRGLETAAAGGELVPFAGETELFLLPGDRFRVVDALLTNFHLPGSSLLLLVAAFAGSETIRLAYAHAIASNYRFFSYGDAMLLHCAPESRP